MTTSKPTHTYAYVSCSPIELVITAPESPYHGVSVRLLGRHRPEVGEEVLLVRQEESPQLIEVPASHTNLDEHGDLPPPEERRFTAEKLLEAARIVAKLPAGQPAENE